MGRKLSYEALKERLTELENELLLCREMQATLRERERRWERMVEDSLTAIYVDQDGKIVFANNQFAKIYGYSRDELIGIESSKLVHPDDRALTDKMRAERLRGEKPLSEYDARGLTRDGKTIWVRRRNTNIDYGGNPAILGNLVDITEEKRFEDQLEKANEDLMDFANVISHDLKTPIISIRGFVSRLMRHYADRLDQAGMDYLRYIEASARRIDALASDLRAFLKSGQMSYDFEKVSARKVLESILRDFEETLKTRHIDLVLRDDFPSVYCDAEKISHVFQNLIENAIKYMGDTPNPRIEISCKDVGDLHQFSIKDNGIGIHPKDHERIFEKFQRLKTAKDEEGTGLGLAIVKRIVEMHGGTVWVESEPGKGTTFIFTLPKT